MVTDFGAHEHISDQRDQVTDQDMNHSRQAAMADVGDVGSGPAMQAWTRRDGEIPAPVRGPNGLLPLNRDPP